MSAALIIYGSITGNTGSVADTIATDQSKADYAVKKINEWTQDEINAA